MIAGKYRVDGVLGVGGMGTVFAATHSHLRRQVAIKLLHPESAVRRGAVERFLREARVAMSLRGEHVVRVLDVGTLEDGSPFIVMECLEGKDFRALVDPAAPLRTHVAVDYVLQAVEAIAEAHVLGVVHRDLKPANLFLTKRVDGSPCVKVLDFGVSKITAGEADLDETSDESQAGPSSDAPRAPPPSEPPPSGRDRLTGASVVIGSPRYMAPEQIRSPADVDARADVWALGVILFELLAGRPPFDGRTAEELRASVTGAPAPAIPGVPAGLQAVVHRCLEKDPSARYPTVHALAEALVPFASGDGAVAVVRIARIAGARDVTSDGPVVRDVDRKTRRPETRTVLVAAAVLAGVAGTAAWATTLLSAQTAGPVTTPSGVPATAAANDPPAPAVTSAEAAPSAAPPAVEPATATATTRTAPPVPLAAHRPPGTAGAAPAVVVDAGAAGAPASNPLHLDAGFLFRERK